MERWTDGWMEVLRHTAARALLVGAVSRDTVHQESCWRTASTVLGDFANASDKCTKTSPCLLQGINTGPTLLTSERPTLSCSPDHSVCYWKAQNCSTCSHNTAAREPRSFFTIVFSLLCGCSSDLGTVVLLPFSLCCFL